MCLKESKVPFGDDSQRLLLLFCRTLNSYKKVLQTSTRSYFKSYNPLCRFSLLSTSVSQRSFWRSPWELGGSRLPWGTEIKPHHLKVHKNENFFGSDFEFCTISLLVLLIDFVKKNFDWATNEGDKIVPLSLRLRGIRFCLV